MNKSQLLLEFLQKNCKIELPIPQSESERFGYYKALINKLPKASVNESFLKIEDGYLKDELKKHEIIDVAACPENISAKNHPAAFCRADAVLSPLSVCADRSVYLYEGTRLKRELTLDKTVVHKANNVCYKGIITTALPEIDSRLTSVILNSITEKYIYALNIARDNNLGTLVLCVPHIDNALINTRVAAAIYNTIISHTYRPKLKIVICVDNQTTLNVYEELIKGAKL